jgi:HK97 family phage portal protein
VGKIINALLGRKEKEKKTSIVDLFTPFFSGSSSPALNDTFMACCQAHARHGAKFSPIAYLNESPSGSKRHITNLLSLRPNPLMNAPTFWEKVTESYFEINNVFLYLDIDYTNYKTPLRAIYPLDPDGNQIEVRKGADNELYFKFNMDGVQYVVSLNQIVHISRNVNAGEIFGHNNVAIDRVLKIMQVNYEGIEQAIKSSAFLRFIVQTVTPLNDDVLAAKAKYFANQYLSKNATGIAYIDSANNIIQVNSQAKYVTAEELKLFEEKIYKYLGINEKILFALYTEDEWAAYYESSLEPLVMKIESELTYKLFTELERAHGNAIRIDANRLQAASLKTRVTIASLIQKLPMYKPNTVNDLLFVPRTEHGDEEYSTLNYVKTDEQSQYQGTGKGKEKPDKKEKDEVKDVK